MCADESRRADSPTEEVTEYREALYIDGRFTGATAGTSIEVENPAVGAAFARVGYGDANDADAALAAAAGAFPSWGRTSARARADVLNRVATLLRERKESIGSILCRETGKRVGEAVAEILFSAEYFQWFAEEIRRPKGVIISGDNASRRQWEVHEPCGVVGVLTPWNFPVSIQARKLAPALAAGCTVVSRPSEKAPCSVVELFRCLHEAGLPAGVANLVQGDPVAITERIFAHEAVRLVSFTGSTAVGKVLMQQAAARVVRLALELGGNSAFIVHSDADMERAVEGAMVAKFRNNGQSCIAANRFFVHERRLDEFVTRLAERISSMRVGEPMDARTDLGPVIDAASQERLAAATQRAVANGAECVHAPVPVPDSGAFVSPVVLARLPADSALGCDEIFGPIAGVWPYRELDEVLQRANSSPVGLAGYVYSQDLNLATRLSEGLRVGIVGVNNALPAAAFAPMGGVKESGFGREGGTQGLREFQDVKYVSMEVA